MPRLALATSMAVALLCACQDQPAARKDALASEASPSDAVAANRQAPPVRPDGTIYADTELMGTRMSINVWLSDERKATEAGLAIRDAFGEIARLESILSEWQATSAVSELNRKAGGPPMTAPTELLDVLELARDVSEATEGKFDITFYGVGKLWSFKAGAQPPSREAIARQLPLVDWSKVEVDRTAGTARLADAGMAIGLGAIAKGYAVDKASELLVARGFEDHIVEGGGDTYVRGAKAGKPWRVGVQSPAHDGALGALTVQDIAVVTSGNYERYFEHEGRRYTHILDPATGWPIPADQSPKSVTLLAANAAKADAYCTAVTIMGRERGLAFVESRSDLDAVIIDHDDAVYVTSGLADRFEARRER